MSSRPSRSASIPIPPSSATRSLENVIPMSFSPPPAPRARMPSAGTSGSFNLNRGIHLPPRATSSSYASAAITAAPRGRPSGPSQTSSSPVFEPRIIRATPSPNPTGDPACNPPPTSPARPRRQSSGVHAQIALGTGPVAHRAHPPAYPGHHTPHGFPRPSYLDYSALRDMLHTEPASSALATTSRHLTYPASGHDVRSGTSPAPAIPYPYLRRELTPSGDSDDESVAATTTSPLVVGAVTMLSTNNVLMLPTRWSEQDRTPSLSVSLDGRELTFTGPSCMGERESSAARTNHSIPSACGIYYYEVEILHKCPKGPISIGFSAPDVRLSRLPGWEKNTWGYHADDGWAFPGHKDGTAYGPTFDTGDIVGCGIDFSLNRVFYTKNGGFLGLVFENVGKTTEIYPCIGMRQTHESIRANFGSSPFRFAIEDHVRTQRDIVWGNIMKTRIDWGLLGLGPRQMGEECKVVDIDPEVAGNDSSADEDARAPLQELVLAYLAHHGYARTARAFQKQCANRSIAAPGKIRVHAKAYLLDDEVKMAVDNAPAVASALGPPGDSEFSFDHELNIRLSITNAIARGDIDMALSLIELHHCMVLELEGGLVRFRLRCRKFVELVLEAGEALRRVKEVEGTRSATPKVITLPTLDGEDVVGPLDGVGAMDVDDPSLEVHFASPSALIAPSSSVLPITSPTAISTPSLVATPARTTLSAAARASLHTALSYGQILEADYKNDTRSSVRVHLRRTFGVVAYDDPVAAGGEVTEIAGQTARNALAAEVNQAILESQGRPAHPALETLFRRAGACMTQLGLLNVGSVAFADARREFIEA